MEFLVEYLRTAWLAMLTPPWKDVDINYGRRRGRKQLKSFQVSYWALGWIWALAGIAAGAVYAPYLATNLGFVGGANADAVETAIAVLTGFLAQLVGWLIFASLGLITIAMDERVDYGWLNDSGLIGNVLASVTAIVGIVVIIAASLAPLVGLYFLFTRYTHQVGTQSELVSSTFISATLIKVALSLGLPLLKSLIVGIILARFMVWLRGSSKK